MDRKPAAKGKLAANLFSVRLFRSLISGREKEEAQRRVREIRTALGYRPSTNARLVQLAYRYLERQYRAEYYYKNRLANELLVKEHRGLNAAMLQEVRIAGSVADCVLINGDGIVYEIKTEFDSPSKLSKQISDYRRAFSLINCVVPAELAESYSHRLNGTDTGLIVVHASGELEQAIMPRHDHSQFDHQSIFNLLRVKEVEEIMRRVGMEIPDVPNGYRYSTYSDKLQGLDLTTFQLLAQESLKSRATLDFTTPVLDRRLDPLRAIILKLGLDTRRYSLLQSWLAATEV